jgi:hypothetical protein
MGEGSLQGFWAMAILHIRWFLLLLITFSIFVHGLYLSTMCEEPANALGLIMLMESYL